MSRSTQPHRRDFLKASSLASAGLWVTAHDLFARGRSPNEKLNVGIIGANGQGGGNLNNIAGLGENIVAICDIDDQRLADPAKRFSQAKTFNDFRKLLEQKDIDAVTVSTADHTHAIATIAALKLGKHVYCEKPLTHNVFEARAVAKAASEAKVATQMGNQGHSSGEHRRIVELIRAGAIGQVSEVHTWTNRPIWPQGQLRPKDAQPLPSHIHWDLWLGPAKERPYHSAYHPFAWRGWWDFGTGALGDMACHIIDPSFWALNLTAPTRIEAGSPPVNGESPPPWAIIRWDFPEREVPANPSAPLPFGRDAGEMKKLRPVTLYWYDGGRLPPYDLWKGETLSADGGTIFVGEGGKRLLENYISPPKLLPANDFQDFKGPSESIPRSVGHHKEWIQACKEGTPTGSNFAFAGALTETVLLGNVALRAGKALEYDAANLRFTNDTDANLLLTREYRKGWAV